MTKIIALDEDARIETVRALKRIELDLAHAGDRRAMSVVRSLIDKCELPEADSEEVPATQWSVAELKELLGANALDRDHTRGVWLDVDGKRVPLTWASVNRDGVILRSGIGPL